MEHGNWPIFSTEFGNIVHILVDFVKKNTAGHRHFYFDRCLTNIAK